MWKYHAPLPFYMGVGTFSFYSFQYSSRLFENSYKLQLIGENSMMMLYCEQMDKPPENNCTLWLSTLMCWGENPVNVCQLTMLFMHLLLSLSSYWFKSKSYLVILLKYTLHPEADLTFSTGQWFHHMGDCSCEISLDDLCLVSFGKLQG